MIACGANQLRFPAYGRVLTKARQRGEYPHHRFIFGFIGWPLDPVRKWAFVVAPDAEPSNLYLRFAAGLDVFLIGSEGARERAFAVGAQAAKWATSVQFWRMNTDGDFAGIEVIKSALPVAWRVKL